jgi:ABC-2 type transport system permease protein
MNIIKREFKANLKSLLLWTIPLMVLHAVASIEFSAFAGDPAIAEAMQNFEILFQALGTNVVDMTTPEGYIGIVSIYIYLPLAIFSGLIGSGIISKEEKDKTAEYLFTFPVKRNKVIASKMVVAVFNSILVNVFVILAVYLTYLRFDVSTGYFQFMVNMSIGIFLIQMIFLGLGMVLSAMLKQYKKSGSITVGILISTFMLSILIGMVDGKIDFLKYITPFQYFPSNEMLVGNFSVVYVIITFVVSIGTFAATFYFYKKRDLYI